MMKFFDKLQQATAEQRQTLLATSVIQDALKS